MLKAKRYVEDMAGNIKANEGRNLKDITALKESFTNVLQVFRVSFALEAEVEN